MKLNLVSFTDYELKIDLYRKKNMDFFTFLLLKIITKDLKEDKTIKEILSYFSITEPIMYLFSNAFMDLLDNKIIISKEEDIEKAIHKDILVTDLAFQCLEKQYILEYKDSLEREVCLNPLSLSLTTSSLNNYDFVLENTLNEKELNDFVNSHKEQIFPTGEEYVYQVNILEANPYCFTFQIKYENELIIEEESLQELIKDNMMLLAVKAKEEYSPSLELLTKEYKVLEETNDKYDLVLEYKEKKYGCNYYLIKSNIGMIPMIEKQKI